MLQCASNVDIGMRLLYDYVCMLQCAFNMWTLERGCFMTMCVCVYVTMCIQYRVFDMLYKAWAKLAQQWLGCASLGIHLEPINKELMLLVII